MCIRDRRCTVGHSHVLEPKRRTIPLAEAVLHRLLQKAAVRIVPDELLQHGVGGIAAIQHRAGGGTSEHGAEEQGLRGMARISAQFFENLERRRGLVFACLLYTSRSPNGE